MPELGQKKFLGFEYRHYFVKCIMRSKTNALNYLRLNILNHSISLDINKLRNYFIVMIKSTLIYDGECCFCKRWAGRLSYFTNNHVEYLSSSEALVRFSQIPTENYNRSIKLVDSEGNVFEGAEAVFRTLACVPGKTWPLWVYQNIPGFALIAEWVYRTVAKNRKIFGTIS